MQCSQKRYFTDGESRPVTSAEKHLRPCTVAQMKIQHEETKPLRWHTYPHPFEWQNVLEFVPRSDGRRVQQHVAKLFEKSPTKQHYITDLIIITLA